jgi:hypothetical protein
MAYGFISGVSAGFANDDDDGDDVIIIIIIIVIIITIIIEIIDTTFVRVKHLALDS